MSRFLYRYNRWLDDQPEPKRAIICLGGLAVLIFLPAVFPCQACAILVSGVSVAFLGITRIGYLNGWWRP